MGFVVPVAACVVAGVVLLGDIAMAIVLSIVKTGGTASLPGANYTIPL